MLGKVDRSKAGSWSPASLPTRLDMQNDLLEAVYSSAVSHLTRKASLRRIHFRVTGSELPGSLFHHRLAAVCEEAPMRR